MKVSFHNVQSENVKSSFLEVYYRYKILHEFELRLVQTPVKGSTMQAQPLISLKSLFTGVKRYRIRLSTYVRDSEEMKIAELPRKVLTGWFAHGLGHVVDYAPYSNLGMIAYGLKYVFSDRFKKKAEHVADHIAIQNGFYEEILATKRFLLENDFMGEGYKAKIRKYYMSMEDVEMCVDGKIPLLPGTHLSAQED